MRGYVHANYYRFADTVGRVDQVESHSDTAITVSAKENSEGSVSFEKVRMELAQSGDVLILDGKIDRVRCQATKGDR